MGDPNHLVLLPDERRTLLRLARHVLEHWVREGRGTLQREEMDCFGFTDALCEPAGVFVTYRSRGRLRGCIGSILPVSPLHQGVIENAIHSASHDPRFTPVIPSELEGIRIEISVMSALIEVKDVKEIELGRDGLILTLDGRMGVFLPQVPVECGWDKQEYLEQLGRKAGWDASAYRREGAVLQRFTAQVFSEGSSSE
jgi:AmmeMemoRadiSam system protein A